MVGAGRMASEWAKAISIHPLFELVGVHSISEDVTAEFRKKFKVASFDSVEDMYRNSVADVVIVAVSELSLENVLSTVLEFPWIRLIEKPFGIDLEQSLSLAELSSNHLQKTFVAHNRRFYSSTRELAKRVAKVSDHKRLIRIIDQQDTVAATAIGKPPKVVANWMFANCVHTIDLFRVFGRGQWEVTYSEKSRLSDNSFVLTAHIAFSSGDVGLYHSLWNIPGGWSLSCQTAAGAWEMRPLETLNEIVPGKFSGTGIPLTDSNPDVKPGLWNMLDEVARAAQQQSHGLVSIPDSIETMKLIAEIYDWRVT